MSTLYYLATALYNVQFMQIDGSQLDVITQSTNGAQLELEVFGCEELVTKTFLKTLTHLYNQTGFYSIVVSGKNGVSFTSVLVKHLVDTQLVALISALQTDWNSTDNSNSWLDYPFWTNGGVWSYTEFSCSLNAVNCSVAPNVFATDTFTPRLYGVANLSSVALSVGLNELSLSAANPFGPRVWRNCSVLCAISILSCTIRCDTAIVGLVAFASFQGANNAAWTRAAVGSVVVTGLLGSNMSIAMDFNDTTRASAFQPQFEINTTQVQI